MSKYWGVGEEDDHIPPSYAEYIPPMRFEPKQAKIKSDTEYNERTYRKLRGSTGNETRGGKSFHSGEAHRRGDTGNRRGTSITKKVGGVCISVHAKSTGACINLLRKCNLNRIR